MIKAIFGVGNDPHRIRTYEFICDECGGREVMPVESYQQEGLQMADGSYSFRLVPRLKKNGWRKCGDKWCCPVCAWKLERRSDHEK